MRAFISLLLMASLCEPVCGEPLDYAARAEDVHPLLIGAQAPLDIELADIEGTARTLPQILDGRPGVLVFFRQGWCPYCDLQLSELRHIEDDLQELGFRVIAVSPDAPRALKRKIAQNELTYELFSDASTRLIRAFGIAFNASTKAEEPVRLMPTPAVYILDARGKVQFHYVNPDYRVRIPKDLLLAAARVSAAPGSH